MELSVPGLVFAALLISVVLVARANILHTLLIALCFPSVAIFNIPALGGASITIPLFFSLVFIANAFLKYKPWSYVFEAPGGQFYLALTIYTVFGAIMFPRLFADGPDIVLILRGGVGTNWLPVALQPTNFNITQAGYFVIDFLLFLAIISWSFCRQKPHAADINAFGITLLVSGAIELPSKLLGFGDPFFVFRTASYAFLTEVNIGNFLRLVGGFSEASGYGPAVVAALSYSCFRYLTQPSVGQGLLIVGLLGLAMFSTSSAAYVALFGLFVAVAVFFGMQALSSKITVGTIVMAAISYLVTLAIVVAVFIETDLFDPFVTLIDQMVFQKASSDSAVERSEWNRITVSAVFETYGLGSGIGSSRASGFFHAVLGTMGIPGLALILAILGSLGLAVMRHYRVDKFSLCLYCTIVVSIVPSAVSAPYGQLGQITVIFAGLCAASLLRTRMRVSWVPSTDLRSITAYS